MTVVSMALVMGAVGAGMAGGVGACITAPPPDLPQLVEQGPKIVHDAVVQPPANAFLTELPPGGVFLVPVTVTNTANTIDGEVFVDFYAGADNMTMATPPVVSVKAPPATDGGVTIMQFTLTPVLLGDPSACRIIQFFVADSFSPLSAHTAGDSLGTDNVVWFYTPNGPEGCTEVDAGNGAAPQDATPDGLPVTPDALGPTP